LIKKYYLYLIIIVFFTLSLKWFLSISEFGLNINSLSLYNLEDIQYFPLVYSLSDFNFSPTYMEEIHTDKVIGFPVFGLLVHSLLFSQIGVYSFIILEYIFQIIFLIVVFKVFIKVFEEHRKSFYFVISLMLVSSLAAISSIYYDNIIFQNLDGLFGGNFGTRFPRPLITGILIFLTFYYILDFQNQMNKSFDNTYVVKVSILLGLILNTYFYYFIIFTILLVFIFLKNVTKKLFSKVIFIKLLLFFTVFLIIVSPFIFQQIYSEIDYSMRIGLIQIENEKKYYLITYFLWKLLSLKFMSIIVISTLFFYYLKKEYKKIDIFFYFIPSSIISTIIFIIFSPSIVSINHFVGIIQFSLILFLSVCIFSVSYEFMKKKRFSKKLFSNMSVIYFIIIFLIIDSFYAVYEFNSKKKAIKETLKIEKFLDDKKIYDTKLKLFSNDMYILNLWLLKKNTNLIVSDAFSNSLKNSQIEYNLINSIKYFGFSEERFKKFISLGKSEVTDDLFKRLFSYRYQANSLYTYSDSNYYTSSFQKKIRETSPFRVQNQVIPEDEKKRLLKIFRNHEIDNEMLADYIIINYSKISKYFDVLNNEYEEVFSTENYKIYSR